TWRAFELDYSTVYMAAGGLSVAIAIYCFLAFPQIEAPTPQLKKMVLRRRYWLFYALEFMAGARRQIFVVFAGFMMVEKFGFQVHEITALYLINLVIIMCVAPLLGKAVGYFGERNTLSFEYAGLVLVFLAYGGLYDFSWGVAVAACFYVVDHIFLGHALAKKTYFQKIADPGDIAPTAAVSFTINHIAAVFLPVALGLMWLAAPEAVFLLAALMALVSLSLSLLIPRHPAPGNETIFVPRALPAQ
ncbi:MAG: MFS transporter, partial [Pseudomonadota bacterium]